MKEQYTSTDEYIADLQAEIESGAKCANHYYNLGVALLSKRDFMAAEEAFLNTVRLSPNHAEAFVALGGICLQRGDLDGCLRYNEEAGQCRNKFPVAKSNIGFVHLQRGEVKKALDALHKAVEWDPEYIQARATLGVALFMDGKYDECIEQSQKVLDKEPGFGPAWNNMALAVFEKGDADKAREYVRKAIACGYEVDAGFLEELGM